MKRAFLIGWVRSCSVDRFRRNLHFYKEVTITNALRSQFDYERYEKLSEGNPRIDMSMIEGRVR